MLRLVLKGWVQGSTAAHQQSDLVRPGTVRTLLVRGWTADKAPVWERIRGRHGLVLPLEQVASWDFADEAVLARLGLGQPRQAD